MAKIQVIGLNGAKSKEIETSIFSGNIREDIAHKIIEVEKYYNKQPYAPYLWAGNQTSASGNVRHSRHEWKSDRGKGMARIPKKRMSDKGERFSWVGAVVPSARGGRRAHPPKTIRADIRYNRKEFVLALLSCLAVSSSQEFLTKKYASLSDKKMSLKLPLVFSNEVLSAKAKEFFSSLRSILGEDIFAVAIQEKSQRPGKGKARGRKYKRNAGLLLIIGSNESRKITGIDVANAKELQLNDIGADGRLMAFTEAAIKELEGRIYGNKKEEPKKSSAKIKEAKK